MATIGGIYRYPVKGLSPEPLARTRLSRGDTVPGDRLYAIENGPSGFDPARPAYVPKRRFLMLMCNERLAAWRTHFDPVSRTLTIVAGGREAARGNLATEEGRAAVERYVADALAGELRGPPRILHAAGHSFSDVARKVISIINLASVAAVAEMVSAPVDPLRFRANLYVEGWPAWSELDLLGRELVISSQAMSARASAREDGAVRSKRITRCAATNVDPSTGRRDRHVPEALMHHLGHADCGIYAEVLNGGDIAAGDAIDVL